MTRHLHSLAAALSLTLASLGQTQATDLTAETSFKAPAAISVAYRDPRIATTPAEAHRQGGFSVAGAAQWRSASEPMIVAEAFKAPGVISVAYRNPRIATNMVEANRQGGFAIPGAVQWLPATPTTVAAKPESIKLGAL